MIKYFIISASDKPLKIVHKELPCPILFNLGETFRCKYTKSKLEDMNFIIYCSSEVCKHIEIQD